MLGICNRIIHALYKAEIHLLTCLNSMLPPKRRILFLIIRSSFPLPTCRWQHKDILNALANASPSSKRKLRIYILPVFPSSMASLMRDVDDSKQVKMSGEVSVEGATEKPSEVTLVSGGDAGAVHCSIPSFAAASELLSTPYSCLVTNTHRRHLSLPPMYLNKKKTGIQEELQAELLRFSQR